ncbi:hypothetical protein HK098_006999 [Nowakowskiella sp. JEL0407]|nr:hypothetical protein HK098_006999 [Nowakowskiella sp. JEL0407]
MVVADEFFEDVSLEELAENLPETTPRFIILSYELKHKDGRVSYPLVGIYYVPDGANDTSKILYASTKTFLFQSADIVGKVYDLQDAEELTAEWLENKLFSSATRP